MKTLLAVIALALLLTGCASSDPLDRDIAAPKDLRIDCGRAPGNTLRCQISEAERVKVRWTVYGKTPADPVRFARGSSASFPIPKDGGALEVSYEDSIGKHFFRILIAWIGDKIFLKEDRRWEY